MDFVFHAPAEYNAKQVLLTSPVVGEGINLAHRSSPVIGEYFRLMNDDAVNEGSKFKVASTKVMLSLRLQAARA